MPDRVGVGGCEAIPEGLVDILHVRPLGEAERVGEEEIWETLQSRFPGTTLKEGPIFQRDVLRFRSFVADVVLLARALDALLVENDARLIDAYADEALKRIWKAQHFSWWMTSMLHTLPEHTEFDRRRQLGELRSVVDSEAGRTFLAEAYTGWPLA